MIPADLASRFQVSSDASLRPVAPVQEIADKLPDLVAGQRVMAAIQMLLPNGTYRAMINQRSVTLALPFSAKAGDSLELLVTESNGKLSLAVLAKPEGARPDSSAVSASLSRTGQLISNLFSGARSAGNAPSALLLAGNQAINAPPPRSGQEIFPFLRQAIAQSGMFYEAHQAEWVEGRLSKAALLQEPQGRLSSPGTLAETAQQAASQGASSAASNPASNNPHAARDAALPQTNQPTTTGLPTADKAAAQASAGSIIAPQAQPIVQQQLEALASPVFTWQGQIWQGHEMRGEIEGDAARQGEDDEESVTHWNTRLHLSLPNLGEIEAKLRLNGEQLSLEIISADLQTRALLGAEKELLRHALGEAGLSLTAFAIDESENG